MHTVKQKMIAAERGPELFDIIGFIAQDDGAEEQHRADDIESTRYQNPELTQI